MLPLMNNVLLINEAECTCVCVCVCWNPHLKENLPMQLFHFICGACVFLSPCCSDKNAAYVPHCGASAAVTRSSLVRDSPSTEQL